MAAIRAVIFDLGHTLWDFAPREESRRLSVLRVLGGLERALEDRAPAAKDLDQAVARTVQRWLAGWDTDQLEQPSSDCLVAEALGALDLAAPADLLHELTNALFGVEVQMPVIEPDGLAAIAILHERGLAMGCVTNTITLREGIVDALQRLGMHRYFTSVIASSAMGYRKPHASLFLRALEELEVPPEEALFVGDRLVDDIGGARSVGMRTVLTHQYRQEALDGAAVPPHAVIRRLGELPEALARL